MRKTIFVATAALLSMAVTSRAQNLNPTVEVTNDFAGKTINAAKPQGKMEVPDSVLKFDLDFDYSVISSPYRGGYDFSPYLVEMKPDADAFKARRFYLRAGAGYTMNPEFDLIWSPKLKNEAVRLNVFARNRSYLGEYHQIGYYTLNGGNILGSIDGSDPYTGFDMNTSVGVNGKAVFSNSSADFSVRYDGLNTKMSFDSYGSQSTNYNAVTLNAGYRSDDTGASHFKYAADLGYRFSSDDAYDESWVNMLAHDFSLNAELGPVIDETHAVLVGAGAELSSYQSAYRSGTGREVSAMAGHLYVAPHYVLSTYRLKLSAGVKVDIPFNSDVLFNAAVLNSRKGQVVYPDVHFDYQLIRESLDVYAAVTGGVDRNPYYGIKQENHFYNITQAAGGLTENTIERFNASLGFRGNIASVFRFDVSGGYASIDGYRHYTHMLPQKAGASPWLLSGASPWLLSAAPYLAYDDVMMAYARMKFVLDMDPVLVDGGVSYTHTNMLGRNIAGVGPAPVSAYLNAHYDWRGRINAGFNTEFVSDNKAILAGHCTVPGFFDLGLDASFAVNRKFSVWLKADNLLFQTIQRTPFYAEKGVKFTAGICLNL